METTLLHKENGVEQTPRSMSKRSVMFTPMGLSRGGALGGMTPVPFSARKAFGDITNNRPPLLPSASAAPAPSHLTLSKSFHDIQRRAPIPIPPDVPMGDVEVMHIVDVRL